MSFALLYTLTTPLAAWLSLAGNLYYIFIYTIWLKRATPLNIVIGGAAGAVPPLVGWAALTGQSGRRRSHWSFWFFCGRRRTFGRWR